MNESGSWEGSFAEQLDEVMFYIFLPFEGVTFYQQSSEWMPVGLRGPVRKINSCIIR